MKANREGSVPMVRASTIAGDTASVSNDLGGLALMSTTGLDRGPVDGAGFTCQSVAVASTFVVLDQHLSRTPLSRGRNTNKAPSGTPGGAFRVGDTWLEHVTSTV